MAITRGAIKKRLERLAVRKGLCPVHMVKLECAYDCWWTGTVGQWEELEPLIDRIQPYQVRMKPSGQLCPQCRDPEPLYCLQCNQEAAQPVWVPDEELSVAEYARYRELVKLMVAKPPGTPHHLLCREDALPKPRDTTWPFQPSTPPAPPPAPIPRPVPGENAPPLPTEEALEADVEELTGANAPPAPVNDDDEDAEIDDALVADLLAQVQRRLAR